MSASLSFPAFGGRVVVVTHDSSVAHAAGDLAMRQAAALDLACSRFRADSELTALNRGGGDSVRLSPLLASAVQAALRAASLSDGLVDPTIGAALVAAGYDRDFALMEREGDDPPAPPGAVHGWKLIRFDAVSRVVSVPPGVLLDLGATAKALYADMVATKIAELGTGVMVSAGGDIAVAGVPPRGGWLVGLAEHHLDRATASVRVQRGGVATSGTTARAWSRAGQSLHHVIDPRTGLPAAATWRTATVAAASAVEANTAATAAIVLGPAAPGWLRARGLPARLVDAEGHAHLVAGWPAEAAA